MLGDYSRMNNNNPYDIIYLLGLLGGVVFSNPVIAQAVAPYAAVFFAALVGSMWALSRQPADTSAGHRLRGAFFIARVVGLALIITVPLASWIAPKIGFTHEQYLFAPLAFLVGGIGDDHKSFFDYCLNFFLRFRSRAKEE